MQCKIAITEEYDKRFSHCYESTKSFKRVKFEDLWQHIYSSEYDSFVITGGEPLLYPRIMKLVVNQIRHYHRDAPIYLHTNGLGLKPEYADLFTDVKMIWLSQNLENDWIRIDETRCFLLED